MSTCVRELQAESAITHADRFAVMTDVEVGSRDLERWRRPNRRYIDLASIVGVPGEHVISREFGGGRILDAYVDFVGSDVTFVSFHAAVSRAKGFTLLYFTGLNMVTREGKVNRIALSDPNIGPNLLLAWFAGGLKVSQEEIENFVRRLIEVAGGKRVIFFGGSGGGFAALNYARGHPGSTAVVMNPQTNILEFNPTMFIPYGVQAWGAQGTQDSAAAAIRANVRYNLVEIYADERPEVNIIYFQNQQDYPHVNRHLRPFVEATGGHRLNVISGDWGPGHARPDRDLVARTLCDVVGQMSVNSGQTASHTGPINAHSPTRGLDSAPVPRAD